MSGVDRRTLIGAGLALAALPARAAPPRRWTGTVERGVHVFRGIRYGTAGRFQTPRPHAPTQVEAATGFGPSCPQVGQRYRPTSEDCLFLNVWSAEPDARAKRPVMVYIHGGAYSTGSVVDPLNDGHALAARGDVVVVTVNHRLNAFGYLYLARLDPRFSNSGNAGQLDLILALRWVRDNIASFGGDPAKVMVFGQSGGGAKIATLMGTPAAKGLFHRAATMSGQQVTASGPLNATRRAEALLDKLGTRDIDAVRAMPAERLVDALAATDPILGGSVYMGPVLDMRSLTRHPFWPDAHPQGNAIPLMLGNTRRETGAFIDPDGAKMRGLTWDNLPERMAPELRIDILPEWVVAQYRARFPDWSPMQVFYDATTAGRSWRGQVIEAEARAAAGVPAWVYQLDFSSRTDPRRGAFHTMDIPLVFGTIGADGSQTGTGADARAASQAMQDAFVTFARSGRAAWPRYDLKTRATMIFDVLSRVENDSRRWQRELFARVPYIQPGT
jgi:para-nitrobenzyl esterase